VKAFYNWLSYICIIPTDDKWSLHPCNMEPGSDAFSVDIKPSAHAAPIDRDSTDQMLAPGAYIILVDGQTLASFSSYSKMTFRFSGTNSCPLLAMRSVDSRHLNHSPVGAFSLDRAYLTYARCRENSRSIRLLRQSPPTPSAI
jgi:hypothetical protein